MQVYSSTNNRSAQSFGMSLMMNQTAIEALRKRVKDVDLDKVNNMLHNLKCRENVGVTLYTTNPNSTRLMANLYPEDVSLGVKTTNPKEGLFHQFRNPVNYLASLINKANAMEKEIVIAKTRKDVFDKLG